MNSVHNLAWNQWDHQNQILDSIDKPHQKKATLILDDEILEEFMKGPMDLPPVDHHHFQLALGDLFNRTVAFRQAWYLNVMAARQRQD